MNIDWSTFFLQIAAAFVLKISTSADDLAWLTPFLIYKKSYVWAYIMAMQLVVFISIGFAFAGYELIDTFTCEECYWDSERVFGFISAFGLLLFAIYLYVEDLRDSSEEEDNITLSEKDSTYLSVTRDAEGDAETQSSSVPELEEADKRFSVFRIIITTLLGSIDEMAVISPLIADGTFSPLTLVIGVFLASVLVALVSLFLANLRPVADCVQGIPVYVVIGAFSIYAWFDAIR